MSVSRKEELSLAKERSLRKLLEAEGKPIEAILKVIYLEAGKNSKTIEEAWQKVPSLSKSKSFISIERALAIFNEHSAETERFLGDLQKALNKFPRTKKGGSMPYLPLGSEWEKRFSDIEKWRQTFTELFSAFQELLSDDKPSLKTEEQKK